MARPPPSRMFSMPEPRPSENYRKPSLRSAQSTDLDYDPLRGSPSSSMGGTFMTLYAANKWANKVKRKQAYGAIPEDGGEFDGTSDHLSTSGHEKKGNLAALRALVTGNKLNIALLVIPFAIASAKLGWGDTLTFTLNFIAMVPLASMLGDFTEELANHTNQTIGGLINATFGNAVEVVVALQALRADQIRVVQASLLGSVFSNMLLVLGCCFFFGGLIHREQRFNSTSAVANMALLLLSSLALVLPAPMAQSKDEENVLMISRFAGLGLLAMYIQLLVFQLRTHTHLYDDEEGEEEEDETTMSFPFAMGGLAGLTLFVAYLSDFLVGSIDGFTEEANLSKTFVGIILLPIVGNAVEHITAVAVAMKGKMELAIGVAVGSAVQVSMFVVPFCVLAGWAMDKPMDLAFPTIEVTLYILSIIIVSTCCAAGSSNWLEGSLLITTYFLIGLCFWYAPGDKKPAGSGGGLS